MIPFDVKNVTFNAKPTVMARDLFFHSNNYLFGVIENRLKKCSQIKLVPIRGNYVKLNLTKLNFTMEFVIRVKT